MNGKQVIRVALVTLLVVALIDLSEACKKCGKSHCSCGGHGAALAHHGCGLGHHHIHHHGHAIAPISYAPICKPTIYKPWRHHHIGGCGCGHHHIGGYGSHHHHIGDYGLHHHGGCSCGYSHGYRIPHHHYPHHSCHHYGGYGFRKYYKPRCGCY